MVFFVRITVNQSHLRPICKSTKFNPKIQRTIYSINFQRLRLHVLGFIRTVVKEYNKALTSFIKSHKNIKGSAAEIIIHKLLQEEILLSDSQFSSVNMVREYKLRDLIRDYKLLSEDEVAFVNHDARLDFLLYSKIDKTPILAIEVDGVSFHDNELQKERDNKKNHILEIIGLPLLRLSTDGHSEKAKIIESLSNAMGHS